MTSIDELKEKAKKQLKENTHQKMGLSELFEDNPVGNPAVQQTSHPGVQSSGKMDVRMSKHPKMATYKMTFNLREEIHKAFNDLYAKRILQGRPTEKSELICEAIELLIRAEDSQIN